MSLILVSHFGVLLMFALFVSLALGFLARRTFARRVCYVLWSFALFVLVSIAIAWLMYPFSR
ncbi:MAG TPA: hypothetical protein VLY23_08490 [Candidatus Acidoferrum sp.]|nr:hypothetical protein [Candidatus Acidoferrum sp.]